MIAKLHQEWTNLHDIERQSYQCGHCGDKVGGRLGYDTNQKGTEGMRVYICPTCNQPTYIDPAGNQFPGIAYGTNVPGVTDSEVMALYSEARRCMSVDAWTAAVMVCRKLVLNVAHHASQTKFPNFEKAIDWLVASDYLPKMAKLAFDQIRQVGNEANHEIPLMSRDDATSMIELSEQLLRLVYQFPNIPTPQGAAPTQTSASSSH